MNARAGWVGVAIAAAVAVAIAVILTTRQPAAAASARGACSHLRAFERIVQRNGAASAARAELARAESLAARAAARDPRWLPLESGVQTLQLAVGRDDARAAGIGIRVVLAQCERVTR